MHRDGRRTVGVSHPVDIARVEVELPARRVTVRPLANPAVLVAVEVVLEQDAVTHEDGPLGAIVVVVSRVLTTRPADQPHIDIRVAVELHVVSLGLV